MSINIGPLEVDDLRPRIAVIGVGGAGGNAVANMVAAGVEGVEFIVANTDAQALNSAVADTKIQLGPEITGGLGAGARPEVGRAAAEETVREIEELLNGVNMCFIAAGMGGGTGTGAAPIIAETARRMGVLTVGVVTKPFLFEGARRMRSAEAGIEELQRNVDTLLVIPNQNLFLVAKADTTFKEAFLLADEVLQQGVRSITDLMVMPGLINLDFADVKSVMEEMGKAMMGTGEAEGPNRALEAAESAIANPLLDGVSMQGAKGVIISIIGGEDMKLLEVDEAANHIRELVDEDANIIWGSAFNPDLDGKIRVSVVATGIESGNSARPATRSADINAALAAPVRPSFSRPAPAAEDHAGAAGGVAAAGGEHGFDSDINKQVFGQPSGFDFAGDREPVEASGEEEPLLLDDIIGSNNSQGIQDGDAAVQAHDEEQEVSWSFGSEHDPVSPSIFDNGESVEEGENGTLNLNDDSALEEGSPLNLSEDFAVADADDDGRDYDDRDEDAPPVTRRRLFSGSGEGKSGSTLFERMSMTNLARGSSDDDEKPTDDDNGDKPSGGSSLNIPRFLNRHNNQ